MDPLATGQTYGDLWGDGVREEGAGYVELEGDPGLLEEDDIKTSRLQENKTCCCNQRGSSTEDSTWYLVFVVKFVDLADITINNKQFGQANIG